MVAIASVTGLPEPEKLPVAPAITIPFDARETTCDPTVAAAPPTLRVVEPRTKGRPCVAV